MPGSTLVFSFFLTGYFSELLQVETGSQEENNWRQVGWPSRLPTSSVKRSEGSLTATLYTVEES